MVDAGSQQESRSKVIQVSALAAVRPIGESVWERVKERQSLQKQLATACARATEEWQEQNDKERERRETDERGEQTSEKEHEQTKTRNRTQDTKAPQSSQLIQRVNVRPHVVHVEGVGRVVLACPGIGGGQRGSAQKLKKSTAQTTG